MAVCWLMVYLETGDSGKQKENGREFTHTVILTFSLVSFCNSSLLSLILFLSLEEHKARGDRDDF